MTHPTTSQLVRLTRQTYLQQLTDEELKALTDAVLANTDPREVPGYDKVSDLFGLQSLEGVPITNDLYRLVFMVESFERVPLRNLMPLSVALTLGEDPSLQAAYQSVQHLMGNLLTKQAISLAIEQHGQA